jgi:hypothetical protein
MHDELRSLLQISVEAEEENASAKQCNIFEAYHIHFDVELVDSLFS